MKAWNNGRGALVKDVDQSLKPQHSLQNKRKTLSLAMIPQVKVRLNRHSKVRLVYLGLWTYRGTKVPEDQGSCDSYGGRGCGCSVSRAFLELTHTKVQLH